MLSIDTRKTAGVTVLDLKGRLVFGNANMLLAEHVAQSVANGEGKVLLNLAEVTYIDSSGLGELVASFTTVKQHGGMLKLSGPTDFVESVLQVVRIPDNIELYATEAEALASFE